jgi:hypothetical protein
MTGRLSHALLIGIAAVALIPTGVLLFARSAAPAVSAAPDVAVSCGPGFRADVRQTTSAGIPRVMLECVFDPAPQAVSYLSPAPAAALPRLVPATYAVDAPAPVQLAPAPARQVRQARTVEPARKKTSWKQHALVIGGSAGAGAGIGAIAGGKKGALIGAAIGGGGAALVQAVRNR